MTNFHSVLRERKYTILIFLKDYIMLKIISKKIILAVLVSIAFSISVYAQEIENPQNTQNEKLPWDRLSVSVGGFLAGLNSDVRLGAKEVGLGIDIDLEKALGLTSTNLILKGDALYRFGNSQRHGVKIGYLGFFRNASKVLGRDIEIKGKTYTIGTTVNSKLDVMIFRGAYNYSFFRDDRFNINTSIGFFVSPISFEISTSRSDIKKTDFIAPLPVFGLQSEFAFTPKLFLKQGIELLYLKFSGFTGSIVDMNLVMEYSAWKQVGLGIGLNAFRLRIESIDEDYPLINFKGNIDFSYTGLLFYAKYYF